MRLLLWLVVSLIAHGVLIGGLYSYQRFVVEPRKKAEAKKKLEAERAERKKKAEERKRERFVVEEIDASEIPCKLAPPVESMTDYCFDLRRAREP